MQLSVCRPISRCNFKPVVMPTNVHKTVAVETIRYIKITVSFLEDQKQNWWMRMTWNMHTHTHTRERALWKKERRSAYSKGLIINPAAIRHSYCQWRHIHPGGSRQNVCATKTSGSVMERRRLKIVSDTHRLRDACCTKTARASQTCKF